MAQKSLLFSLVRRFWGVFTKFAEALDIIRFKPILVTQK